MIPIKDDKILVLRNGKHPFIAIIPRSTLTRSGNIY